jgi:hypothetical protein
VSSSTHVDTIFGANTLNGGTGLESLSTGDGASDNYAIKGLAEDSTASNVGVYGYSGKTTIGKNIGLYGSAQLGAENYAIRLTDGTQGIGKVLKCVTALGEANWEYLPYDFPFKCSDETTALTAGTNKIVVRVPRGFIATGVRAGLVTAQTSGSIFTVDINLNGTSILSTKLTIDNGEKTSVTSVTQPVLSTTSLTDDAEISVDIDQIGDGTAKGLQITILGYVLL